MTKLDYEPRQSLRILTAGAYALSFAAAALSIDLVALVALAAEPEWRGVLFLWFIFGIPLVIGFAFVSVIAAGVALAKTRAKDWKAWLSFLLATTASVVPWHLWPWVGEYTN